jgi:hypothetical protein
VKPIEEKDSVELFKTKIATDKYSESDLNDLVQALEGIPLVITHGAPEVHQRLAG